MLKPTICSVAIGLLLVTTALGLQKTAIKSLVAQGATAEVYKTTVDSKGSEVKLNIYIFKPKDHKASDRRPAIVFFFGGGWNGGSPNQFASQCKHLAERGMVAMTADYRVKSRQGTKAVACVEDGKSAVRWIRQNADRLGIDPNKVAAGGGSAGGHVAATTGTIKKFDRPEEDNSISSVPNAMVLFNPALVLAPIEGDKMDDKMERKFKLLEARLGTKSIELSPHHNIAEGTPPTIVFHGTADKTVPFASAEAFTEAMKQAGNQCKLKAYENQGHGFFNADRNNGKYKQTVEQMDEFLVALGFLKKTE